MLRPLSANSLAIVTPEKPTPTTNMFFKDLFPGLFDGIAIKIVTVFALGFRLIC